MTELGESVAVAVVVEAPNKKAKKKRKKKPSPECDYWRKTHKSDYNGPDSKFVTSTQISPVSVAFRLEVNIVRRKLRIISVFKWGTVASDVNKRQKRRTIRMFKAKVAAWSGRYKMKIVDPECGKKTMPIMFRLQWSPDDTKSSAPYKVNLYKTFPRAAVTGWDVDIGHDSDVVPNAGWVLQHEYGHTLCLPDEYFYGAVTSATVVYKKADGSNKSITLEPANNNIMRTHASWRFRKRFFYFVAVEAQELLRQKSGRNVTCEII